MRKDEKFYGYLLRLIVVVSSLLRMLPARLVRFDYSVSSAIEKERRQLNQTIDPSIDRQVNSQIGRLMLGFFCKSDVDSIKLEMTKAFTLAHPIPNRGILEKR